MKQKKDLAEFYKNLGDFLKQRCTNSTAYIYFGEREYLKRIGLKSGNRSKPNLLLMKAEGFFVES